MEHVERLRVAWVDTDAAGRIHFTAVFRYAEAAEGGYLRALGLLDEWGSYPRRHVEAEYRETPVFDDELEVAIRPSRVGRTSVTWTWQIRRGGEPCVLGSHTAVHVDAQSRPEPLPAALREALEGGLRTAERPR
jgi:acyl-CoA thioester hydrolase